MDRKVTALVVALLCVLAVSVAASTLTNPEHVAGGEGGGTASGQTDPNGQPGPNEGSGDEKKTAQKSPNSSSFKLAGACLPFLTSPWFYVLALAFIAGLTWWLKRRRSMVYAYAVVFPLTLFMFPVWLVLTDCGGSLPSRVRRAFATPGNESTAANAGGGAGGSTSTLLSPPALLAILLVVAVVVLLLAYRMTGDDDVEEEDPVPEQEPPEEPDALEAVGAAAGEAADRIDDSADLENEVYRAWREMTDHLNVDNPDASTPAEFAAAARDAGMDGSHVDRLTDVFRDVRYGGEEATEDREQEAVDALRVIEDTYAADGENA